MKAVIRLAKILLVTALMVSIGAHWAVIQGAAWLSMAVTYSAETGSVMDGLEMTFDGMHPCAMCKVVQEGTQEQKKQDDSQKQDSLQKLHLQIVTAPTIFPPTPERSPHRVLKQRAMVLAREAHTPPPRSGIA